MFRQLLIVAIVVLLSFGGFFAATRPVGAIAFFGPGLVCVTDSSPTSCPATSDTVTGPVGSHFSAALNVVNSPSIQPFSAFDIRLKVDPSNLNATSVDLTNSVFPASTLVDECINGVGTGCAPVLDGPGVVRVHMNATGVTGTNGVGVHLFGVTYSVVGTTVASTIGFQTGCSQSSVAQSKTCVLLTETPPLCLEGACVSVDSETTQTATFTGVPGFTVTGNPISVTVFAGASGSSTITVTSFLGFTGTVNLAVSSGGLACSLSTSSITLTSATTSGISILTCSGTAGTYHVTVAGNSGATTASETTTYTVQDFALSAHPSSLLVDRRSSGTIAVTVTSLDGFVGTVTFTTILSPLTAKPPTLSTLPNISLSGFTTENLTVSTTHSTRSGVYTILITASSNGLAYTVSVTVTVGK